MSIGMYVNLLHFTGEKKDEKTKDFCEFKKKIFHESMTYILRSLKQHMTEPIVLLWADGHYRKAIFALGPYITDYPEQVLVSGIVQGWCLK